MDERSFKSTPLQIALSILSVTLLSWIILAFIAALISGDLDFELEKALVIAFIPALADGIIIPLIFLRTTVTVYSDKAVYKRGVRAPIELSLSENYFAQHVVKHSTNGIMTSTERKLAVYPMQNSMINERYFFEYKCSCMSRKVFEEMVDCLKRTQLANQYGSDRIAEPHEAFSGNGTLQAGESETFRYPKEAVIEMDKKSMKNSIVGALVISEAGYAFILVFTALSGGEVVKLAVSLQIFLLAILAFSLPTAWASISKRNNKNTFAEITVSHDEIIIDGQSFDVRSIQYGRITSPGIKTAVRKMSFRSGGVDYSYRLGRAPASHGKQSDFMPEYDELFKRLYEIGFISSTD